MAIKKLALTNVNIGKSSRENKINQIREKYAYSYFTDSVDETIAGSDGTSKGGVRTIIYIKMFEEFEDVFSNKLISKRLFTDRSRIALDIYWDKLEYSSPVVKGKKGVPDLWHLDTTDPSLFCRVSELLDKVYEMMGHISLYDYQVKVASSHKAGMTKTEIKKKLDKENTNKEVKDEIEQMRLKILNLERIIREKDIEIEKLKENKNTTCEPTVVTPVIKEAAAKNILIPLDDIDDDEFDDDFEDED